MLRIPLLLTNNAVRLCSENKHLHDYFLVYHQLRYDPNRRFIADAGYSKQVQVLSILSSQRRRRKRIENSTIQESFISKIRTSATSSLFSSTFSSSALSSTSSSTATATATATLAWSSPTGKKKKRKKTPYTIDDSVCLPTQTKKLELLVHKACRSVDIYLDKKPMMRQTRQAFARLVEMMEEATHSSSSSFYHGIVLDSGCGTGRSTKLLAKDIHPRSIVIVVDRSLARLTQTKDNRQHHQHNIDGVSNGTDKDNSTGEGDDNSNSSTSSRDTGESTVLNDDEDTLTSSKYYCGTTNSTTYCHQISENAYLVQAELVDFWRCCIDHGWTTTTTTTTKSSSISDHNDGTSASNNSDDDGNYDGDNNDTPNGDVDDDDADDERVTTNNNNNTTTEIRRRRLQITHHYLLYPNPYPTNVRLSKRWYAHPSFPVLLQLQADTIILRSNWNLYLQEFATSIALAHDFYSKNSNYSNSNNDHTTNDSPTTTTTTTTNGSTHTVIIENDTTISSSSRDDTTGTGSTNLALPYLSSAKVGPKERSVDDKSSRAALTNFERKYDTVGETTYELILQKKNRPRVNE